MKTNNFRLGNLINNDNEIIEISNGRVTCWGCSFSGMVYYEGNEIKPIPITEERLIKYGFKKEHDPFSWYYIKEIRESDEYDTFNICVRLYDNGTIKVLVETGSNSILVAGHTYTEVKDYFVHQLQNLYFILAGKELVK